MPSVPEQRGIFIDICTHSSKAFPPFTLHLTRTTPPLRPTASNSHRGGENITERYTAGPVKPAGGDDDRLRQDPR